MPILVCELLGKVEQRDGTVLVLKENYIVDWCKSVLKKLVAKVDVDAVNKALSKEILFDENVVCLLNKAAGVGSTISTVHIAIGESTFAIAINHSDNAET